jgi:hypothetical protein
MNSALQLEPPPAAARQLQHQQSAALSSVLESREIQQVQVAMLAAKRFRRNEKDALDRILNACCRVTLASQAHYAYSRGGTDIQGPTIRLAEAIAQHWGNMDHGWREVTRYKDGDGTGASVIEAFAWDLESNARSSLVFTVRHWRDTKGGGYPLKDERDSYELCANMAKRRVRSCILAVIPGDIVEEASNQCDATLAANCDTGPEEQKKMLAAFERFNVTKAQIEDRIQRRLDSVTPAQFIMLRKIYASLKDGMSVAADWFEPAKSAASDQPLDPFKQADIPAQPQAPAKAERKPGNSRRKPDPDTAPADPPQMTNEEIASAPLQPWGNDGSLI